MQEKKFPIYHFSLQWNQVDFPKNFVSWHTMFKEKPTEDKLNDILNNEKERRINKHIEEGRPIVEWLDCEWKYVEDESWCLQWFNHYTYNKFETDQEVRKSFDDFIYRKMAQNRANGHGEIEKYDYDNKNPFYCLMGAEDRWRWKICRCEHCQKAGKITINH